MAENEKQLKGRLFLKQGDFVKVEGPEGEELPAVPKHWGEELLAPGAKKKGRTGGSSSTPPAPTTPPATPDPKAEPAGNASTEAWAKYAVEVKGAKPEDLLDDKGEALTRDALKDKFGTPSDS